MGGTTTTLPDAPLPARMPVEVVPVFVTPVLVVLVEMISEFVAPVRVLNTPVSVEIIGELIDPVVVTPVIVESVSKRYEGASEIGLLAETGDIGKRENSITKRIVVLIARLEGRENIQKMR
jgi:hypothetical protein